MDGVDCPTGRIELDGVAEPAQQLEEFVGRKVRVNTTQMLGQIATVEQYGPKSVRLRVHFTGGTATYDVPRDNLRRIVAM